MKVESDLILKFIIMVSTQLSTDTDFELFYQEVTLQKPLFPSAENYTGALADSTEKLLL